MNLYLSYLLESENYHLGELGLELKDIQARYQCDCKTRPGMVICATQTNVSSIKTILITSSTTAHVNVITWNKLYSAFP